MYHVDYKAIDSRFLFFVSVFKGIWIFILLFLKRQILHELEKLIFYFPYLSYRHEENVVILQTRETLLEFVICRVFNLISTSCIN